MTATTLSKGPYPPIVLTGPTGWIGNAFVNYAHSRFGADAISSARFYASQARAHVFPGGLKADLKGLEDLKPADIEGAVVIHLAYLTKEKADALGERTFTDTNIDIDDKVLSALQMARPRGVFIASSGAAKLAEKGTDRHPYGMCKLRQEDRFLQWSAKSGVPVIVGRIFNLAGPYINKVNSYALGSFVLQARREGRIRIEADVPVFRSFLHVNDLCALVFEALSSGVGRNSPVDLCGSEILEMGDIAAAVARHTAGEVEILRGGMDCSRPSVYLGNFVDTKVLAMEFGTQLAAFDQQVIDTMAWIDGS